MYSKEPANQNNHSTLGSDSSTLNQTLSQEVSSNPQTPTKSPLISDDKASLQDTPLNTQGVTEENTDAVKANANPHIKSFLPKAKANDPASQTQSNNAALNQADNQFADVKHKIPSDAANPEQETNSAQNTNAAQDKNSLQDSSNTIESANTNKTEEAPETTKANKADAPQAQQNEQTTQTEQAKANDNANAAVYDGSTEAAKNDHIHLRKHVFLRSLQFRIIWIVILAGFISMTVMSILSYHKITEITHDFVDEELSQIASVAINYRMIIPRRWEAPRHYHDRVLNLVKKSDGSIVVQLSTQERNRQMKELAQEASNWFSTQERQSNAEMGRGQGGPGRGLGPGHGMGAGANEGAGNPKAIQNGTPSLSDLSGLNYDIMIAPLFGRPGDALYIPLGVSDGFYTVIVADERVRAFVATNANGQRFVVARPLSSLTALIKQSFYASFHQFFWIDLIGIPLIIILSINFMLRSLNRIAQDLYQRSEEDLSPVVANDGGLFKTFIPSELDGFIISINRLFQRVDESMQSKRRFIADAAHEMRTQSTVLSLQIAALDNEELSPSARKKIKRLKEGIAREKSLMTSLLTLAREQGCSDLTLESINIFDLYTKLIEEQGLLADSKNIDLGVEGEVNYTVISDRTRLTRIMSNLLSNAIKYTPEDGRIDLKAEQTSDGSLILTVQDDGPGIPQEHLKHILEPFYRVDGDRSAVQGTGLGLAIVKASCDSLKAKLQFSNATPHGLIASVTLRDLQPSEGNANNT